MSLMRLWVITLAVAALAGCGGGGGSTDNTAAAPSGGAGGATPLGTLRVSLTDNPACGYDNVWVTVEKVRVHRDASAGDGDAGWVDLLDPAVADQRRFLSVALRRLALHDLRRSSEEESAVRVRFRGGQEILYWKLPIFLPE